jgi:hypothetical protein
MSFFRKGTNPATATYLRRSKFREAPMKMARIILASAAFIALGSAASAQQGLTGTVTRIDRLDGTISIQLQKPQTQTGTVGAAGGGPAEELKTKVEGNLLNTLHAGDKVKFSITQAGGSKTITNVERQ